ncbi:MAG TPA: 2,3-diphosphoglycerate-dependent phosphoglycerate mutase [Pedomonas sp.]|uniref:2,3-diphosphoglycerate-dependent phosphoglycerate mutase n=1 Tax=Pedomonas sp. TaxID=2976421 RepID=UPI002F40C701
MPQLVLIRHGQSAWNLENRFTGWWDVNITDKGVEEARAAGQELKARGFEFDIAYTSLLTRANKTLNLVLEEMGELWLPVVKDWRLNERHYGALTGLNKAEMVAKVGEEQVFIWRRSYDIPPPDLEETSEFDVSKDRRYIGLPVPRTESLKDTVARVLPLWDESIAPNLKAGKRLIIAAHGNSIRGIVKHLDGLTDEEITKVEIPTGQPLIYDLDDDLKPVRSYYLNDL